MADLTTLGGAMTALITPFSNGEVDHSALAALVERQISGGIDGLVPCGTTGESATMSERERLAVIETVVHAAEGRVPIIAGTASNDTQKSIDFTRKVAEIEGVDAALVVCPYYNKPNQPMLVEHFTRIADEGGLPVVLYNVPGRTVISMTPQTVATLARHEQVVAIKEATGDMNFDTRVIEALGDTPLRLLSGDDFTTMPFVAMGGHGCISVLSNLLPGVMSELVRATAAMELDLARSIHVRIQRITRLLFENPNPVPTKEIAERLGWCTAQVRGPLCNSDAAFLDKIDAIIADYPELIA
ncbi:unnamed protein product [Laminaria digitata]